QGPRLSFATMSRISFVIVLGMAASAWADGPPATKKIPAAPGDDYRWLENGDDPEVKKWTEDQNKYARSILDNLPSVKEIRARVTELIAAPSVDYRELDRAGKSLFALKIQPPKNQPFLVVMSSAEATASEKVVVDPNAIDPSGHTAIDFFVP